MLTGDKLETATCIAQSSRLVARNQMIHTFKQVTVYLVSCLGVLNITRVLGG